MATDGGCEWVHVQARVYQGVVRAREWGEVKGEVEWGEVEWGEVGCQGEAQHHTHLHQHEGGRHQSRPGHTHAHTHCHHHHQEQRVT